MMKVLVVDDERDVRELFLQRFRREIKQRDVSFLFAYSGEEALEILRSAEQEAMLILSDINMPTMSGLELLRRVKRDFRKPPPVVMMVTAYGDAENYSQAIHLGADDFITKPVDFAVLKSKLSTLHHG